MPPGGIGSIAGYGGPPVRPGGIRSNAGFGGPLVPLGGCGKHIERSIVGRKLGLGVVCGSFSHSPGSHRKPVWLALSLECLSPAQSV